MQAGVRFWLEQIAKRPGPQRHATLVSQLASSVAFAKVEKVAI